MGHETRWLVNDDFRRTRWLVNNDFRVMTVEEHDKEYRVISGTFCSMAGNPAARRYKWPSFDTHQAAFDHSLQMLQGEINHLLTQVAAHQQLLVDKYSAFAIEKSE